MGIARATAHLLLALLIHQVRKCGSNDPHRSGGPRGGQRPSGQHPWIVFELPVEGQVHPEHHELYVETVLRHALLYPRAAVDHRSLGLPSVAGSVESAALGEDACATLTIDGEIVSRLCPPEPVQMSFADGLKPGRHRFRAQLVDARNNDSVLDFPHAAAAVSFTIAPKPDPEEPMDQGPLPRYSMNAHPSAPSHCVHSLATQKPTAAANRHVLHALCRVPRRCGRFLSDLTLGALRSPTFGTVRVIWPRCVNDREPD